MTYDNYEALNLAITHLYIYIFVWNVKIVVYNVFNSFSEISFSNIKK